MSGLLHKWNWNLFLQKEKKMVWEFLQKEKKYGLIYAVSAYDNSFTLHKCHNSLAFLIKILINCLLGIYFKF